MRDRDDKTENRKKQKRPVGVFVYADMMDGYASTFASGRCAAVKYTEGTMYNRQDKVGLKSVSVISVRVICGTTVSRSCKL